MTVFLNEHIHPDALALLKKHHKVVDSLDNPEEIEAIIVRVFNANAEVIAKCPRLKIIAKHGVGYNTIDIQAAKKHNVIVTNTPFANTNSVAELIVALALNLARRVTIAHLNSQRGLYKTVAPSEIRGVEFMGKRLGLVGTGNIAQRVANILSKGFNMSVYGYDPYMDATTMASLGIHKVDNLEELMWSSDLINISVPLTTATTNLINAHTLSHCKKSAILINAARGGIVNENDLYEALLQGQLSAAACDAFVEEPPSLMTTKLLTLDNFIGTPHIGACTEEALYRMGMESVQEILSVLSGNPPKYRVA